jgi:hypothetical protein
MSLNDKADGSKPSTPRTRKPYTPPRVVSYGHVKDIIQGGGGKKSDAGAAKGAGNSKACWIAEALYGVEDPRTLLLRAWLSTVHEERRPGWQFVTLYSRFGQATARLIYQGYLPRGLFRPLFDALVNKALDESAHTILAR